MRVAVVGAGIAGLTAALRLAERGYDVTLYEEKEIIGGNLSSQNVDGVYHDVYPHMFCDWYANFWELFESDLGLDRNAHFEPRMGVKLLQQGETDYLELRNSTDLPSVWSNLRSGVIPFPDMFLVGYSLLDLAAQSFDRSELLGGLSVNGFLYSRPYASERCAELHDLILMEIWSIHGDRTSAASYRDFIRHTFALNRPRPFAWMLKGSLQERLIAPLERKLRALGCTIRTGTKVKTVRVVNGTPEIQLAGGERPMLDALVLAVPARVLGDLVTHGKKGTRIVDRLPQLSELRRLGAERIAVVDLYFKHRLPDIPKEHVGLAGSDCDLTFLDISQLWTGDDNMRNRTALVLAASDAYALPSEMSQEEGHKIIRTLHRYLPVFEPGHYWGDPASDIDWEKSRFLPNDSNKLYINDVGSWGWRPETCYDALPNVFFAGDFCRTDVSMATVEGAVQSGLQAAQALWTTQRLGDPIAILEPPKYGDTGFLALKLALIPFAYGAKWWSIAFDAVPDLARADLARGIISPAANMLLLPFTYTVDWWETAYAFWRSVFSGASAASEAPWQPEEDGPAVLGALWNAARSAYQAGAAGRRAQAGPYRRRWRVKP